MCMFIFVYSSMQGLDVNYEDLGGGREWCFMGFDFYIFIHY